MTRASELALEAVRPLPDDGAATPLAVDLDGTLIRSDLLVESFLALLKQSVFFIFALPLWLLRGKAFLKEQIARRVELEVRTLPYQREFIDFLKDQRARGRLLVLATASHRKYAEQVAAHLGIFDEVIATDGKTNVSGSKKLEKLVARFGEGGFDYAADAWKDLPVWSHARRALLVNAPVGLETAIGRTHKVDRVFRDRSNLLIDYLREIRLYQWVKNALVFVPLFASHQANDLHLAFQCVVAFVAFGLAASSAYVLNDLFDLPADRGHPSKRNRPVAAGQIPIAHAGCMVVLLAVGAGGVASAVSLVFMAAVAGYYVCTLAYSVRLKHSPILDVCVLAGLYTLRIIAGAIAIDADLTVWLLGFSMFLFLSLALVKRCSELIALQMQAKSGTRARSYRIEDLTVLQALGTSSAMAAVLVLALYVNNPATSRLYGNPEAIWLLCPLFLYWIGRIWLITHRAEMHDDPIVFTFRDPISLLIGFLCAVVLLIAM